MSERTLHNITQYLSTREVQQRVQQNIDRVRNEAMVTIGQAARLFGFSESQLRDWEKIGLLRPVRPAASPDAKSDVKQRQYSFDELDKLAIIDELIHHAGLTPSFIPTNIDELWNSIRHAQISSVAESPSEEEAASTQPKSSRYITSRVERLYRDESFWRLYVSRSLLLSIHLLYEHIPGTYAGLILPSKRLEYGVPESETLPRIGEALVGWLNQTRSFYTFLTPAPEFEFPSDFSIYPLYGKRESAQIDGSLSDPTLIALNRDKVNNLHLDAETVNVVHRLLTPIYEDRQYWSQYMGQGMKDLVQLSMDQTPRVPDAILTGLANMVIRLGGKLPGGESRWHHCCILLPDNTYLPLQQRRLNVRVVSEGSSHMMNVVLQPLEHYSTTISVRAFRGNCVLYHEVVAGEDTTEAFAQLEGSVGSCVAVPIGGEVSQPLGILYVASYHARDFSTEDLRLLRLMARMAEEILRSYDVSQRMSHKLSAIIKNPVNTDTLFDNFRSEDQLARDIDNLLAGLQERIEQKQAGLRKEDSVLAHEVSFIAVELSDQSDHDTKYDYLLLRNVYLRIGELINKHFRSLSSLPGYRQPYHIYGSRYYIFLPDVSLEEAQIQAKRLKKALDGTYTFNSLYVSTGNTFPLAPAQNLSAVVTNIGVSSYLYTKLEGILQRYPRCTSSEVRALVRNTILNFLETLLNEAQKAGGDIIMSWDRQRDEIVPLPRN